MDYPDEEYTDEEEYKDNVLDEQREQWEEGTSGMPYPTTKKPESLFSLFKDVWRTKDSSKVANLDTTELGDLGISVRDCQRVALLSELLHHHNFGKYFDDQGEIILATSMSKKGWFVEMFVTTRKFAHKGMIGNLGKYAKKQKWRIFGKQQETETEA